MLVLDRTTTVSVLIGALAIVLLAFAVREGAPGDRAGVPSGALVPVVDGGDQGGYLDGRPIPSGFDMPVIVRWKQSAEAEADPATVQAAPPVEASVTP